MFWNNWTVYNCHAVLSIKRCVTNFESTDIDQTMKRPSAQYFQLIDFQQKSRRQSLDLSTKSTPFEGF